MRAESVHRIEDYTEETGRLHSRDGDIFNCDIELTVHGVNSVAEDLGADMDISFASVQETISDAAVFKMLTISSILLEDVAAWKSSANDLSTSADMTERSFPNRFHSGGLETAP